MTGREPDPLHAQAQAAAPADSASATKFSVMLWALSRAVPMEQRLEWVAAAGYNGGELVTEWRTWSVEERKRLSQKSVSLNLTFDLMFPSTAQLTDPGSRQKLAAEIKEAIPVAQELRCKQFGFRSGARVAGQSPEVMKQTVADALKVAVEQCHGTGIEIVLEPIDLLEAPKEAVNTVGEAAEIARMVGDPSAVILCDFYHEQRGAGNVIAAFEKNFDRVALVHIADVPGRHHPGTGEMNYSNIYRKLAEMHYRRWICMEFLPTGDAVTELKAARQEALTAMRSV